jgi:hypothetical protein
MRYLTAAFFCRPVSPGIFHLVIDKSFLLFYHWHRHRVGNFGYHLCWGTTAQPNPWADVDAVRQDGRAEMLDIAGNDIVPAAQGS